MKLKPSPCLTSPKLTWRAVVACALECALFFLESASPALAASGSGEGVRLVGEQMSTGGSYQFSFTANAGQAYPIGVSADLVQWSLLTNVVGRGAPLSVVDLEAPKFQRRFYQIVPAALTNMLTNTFASTYTNMVFVRPGTFTMGSPQSEQGRNSTEGPTTVVTLSRGFWIGKYEVTQEEYVAVIGTNDSFFTSILMLPADTTSWTMAANYCSKLTDRERAAGRLPVGYTFRLPTEAEWEYACRAGTTNPFGIGDGTSLGSSQANFDGNFPYGGAAKGPYFQMPTLPGHYMPNAWGLYDMHGNVWEWCQDWYGPYPGGEVTDPKGPATGSERVLRGGGYTSLAKGCRSAVRDSREPEYRNTINGFRVVLASLP